MVAYSFKQRFIRRIETGLGIRTDEDFTLLHPAKTQTIRAEGKRRHAKPGEVLQLYYGMRTRQCKLIGVAKCVEVLPIIIWDTFAIIVDGKVLTARQIKKFASADGFDDLDDMRLFWKAEHGAFEKFEGRLIKWEPIR